MFGNLCINSFYTFGLNHPVNSDLDMPVTNKALVTDMPSWLGGQNTRGYVLQTLIPFMPITKINITLNLSKLDFGTEFPLSTNNPTLHCEWGRNNSSGNHNKRVDCVFPTQNRKLCLFKKSWPFVRNQRTDVGAQYQLQPKQWWITLPLEASLLTRKGSLLQHRSYGPHANSETLSHFLKTKKVKHKKDQSNWKWIHCEWYVYCLPLLSLIYVSF